MDGVGRNFPPGHIRVSDADRDRAISELGQALQAGRITADEFDERSARAVRARTGNELTVLVADLPAVSAPDRVPARIDHLRFTAVEKGAAVAAGAFSVIAAVNANQPAITDQQREQIRQMFAREGISVTIPSASGFDWGATLTPAVIAVLLIVLVIVLRKVRAAHHDG
ncbi:MAG TPA: DUF1707 domain-containing protein [Streptosporangiaceae bacterium]